MSDIERDLRLRISELERFRGEAQEGGGEAVAVVGDIHGDADLLERLLSSLAAEPGIGRVVVLGDYFDRNDRNLRVFRAIRALHESGRGLLLLGNHDLWMVQALLGHVDAFATWITNGGFATLREFGIPLPDLGSDPRPEAVFEKLQQGREKILAALEAARASADLRGIADWMRKTLLLHHLDGRGFLFIHAGVPVSASLEPDLSYGGAEGLDALRRMEQEFRAADSPEAGIFEYLNSPASPLLVRERWLHTLRRAGKVENLLPRIPANGIVFAHTPVKKVLAVEGRVFGVDVMDEKGVPGGALEIGPGGIHWRRFEGKTLVREELFSRETLQKNIEKWIRSHTSALHSMRAGGAPTREERQERLRRALEGLAPNELRLLHAIVVGCFQHDPVRGREIFSKEGPLGPGEGPTVVDLERYLDLREHDRNLLRAVRMAVITRARLPAAREAAEGLQEKLSGFRPVPPLRGGRRYYLEQPVTPTEEGFFRQFIEALDPDERKWVFAWVLSLWNAFLSRMVLGLPQPPEGLGLTLTTGLVKSFFELQSAERSSVRHHWFTLLPGEGTGRLKDAYERLQKKVQNFGDLMAQFPTQVDMR